MMSAWLRLLVHFSEICMSGGRMVSIGPIEWSGPMDLLGIIFVDRFLLARSARYVYVSIQRRQHVRDMPFRVALCHSGVAAESIA
jgi:hypothetical protein